MNGRLETCPTFKDERLMANTEPQHVTRPPSVLDDPGSQAVADVYADAFLDAAQSAGVEGELEEFRSFIEDVLQQNPDFDRLLRSPMVNRDDKLRMIDRIVASRGTPLFTNFLRVLARHDRLDLLPIILNRTQIEHEKRSGRRRVQVTSARPLSDDARRAIQDRLASVFPFQPILEVRTDPALLGGLVIRVGDTVYDGSLRTRLRQLRARLRERYRNEIQRGRDRFRHSTGD